MVTASLGRQSDRPSPRYLCNISAYIPCRGNSTDIANPRMPPVGAGLREVRPVSEEDFSDNRESQFQGPRRNGRASGRFPDAPEGPCMKPSMSIPTKKCGDGRIFPPRNRGLNRGDFPGPVPILPTNWHFEIRIANFVFRFNWLFFYFFPCEQFILGPFGLTR
jgi:hypothetical protein